jgi:nitrogen-specific signal transduction histidine kinase/DNA-binding response OmpR family regulator
MKTLLVVTEHLDFTETICSGLKPGQWRIINSHSLEQGEPMLERGCIDSCIVDADSSKDRGRSWLRTLQNKAPGSTMILYAHSRDSEWEREVYLRGASYVLAKPVDGLLVAALLDRPRPGTSSLLATRSLLRTPVRRAGVRTESEVAAQATHVLRGFSRMLSHSLSMEELLRPFLYWLRDLLSINRAVIFLAERQARAGHPVEARPGEELRPSCAFGLSPDVLQECKLSWDTGIGGHLSRFGRVLRRGSEELRTDLETQREFEIFGTHFAVPILDGGSLLGALLLDGRVTGEPLVNAELELVFHLLEHLGLAIKNIRLHEDVRSNRELLAEVLRELKSACVVIHRDLAVLHANKMADQWFAPGKGNGAQLEFSDLPPALASKIYQVLKTGSGICRFRYELEDSTRRLFGIEIVPINSRHAALPDSALLVADDLTQTEQLQRLEIEAAKLRLEKSMAYRLANEILNAIVEPSTYQQLLAEQRSDPAFLSSLNQALARSMRRVRRLGNQMRFLARDELASQSTFPIGPLLEEAHHEACLHQEALTTAPLKCALLGEPIVVPGDREALKQALTEIMINALQANPSEPRVGVCLRVQTGDTGLRELHLDLEDNGSGFTGETSQRAMEPFFTTRVIGSGLGLAVAHRIIQAHQGKLQIIAPAPGQKGAVRVSLPLPER